MLWVTMYNVEALKEAASKSMEKFYTCENIVEILDFKKKYQDNLEDCLKYIVAEFDYTKLQDLGILEQHPEISKLYLDLLLIKEGYGPSNVNRYMKNVGQQMQMVSQSKQQALAITELQEKLNVLQEKSISLRSSVELIRLDSYQATEAPPAAGDQPY